MLDQGIQIVSNEAGEPTAVIVPIELWKEIASERETAHLLRSEAMKGRLLSAWSGVTAYLSMKWPRS